MKKHGVNKFIGLLLPLSLITSMLFSFVSFAKAYTGAYLYTGVDPITGLPITEVRGVNPTGETFSGENKIEMNAFNNAPILTDNTFNGSTDITTAYTDITSNGNTYNGTTTLDYSSVTGGTLQSSSDTFGTTSVEASDADVSISNGTFNGALTVNANSVSLGSVSQMDDLLTINKKIIDEIYIFRRLVGQALTSSSNSITNTSPSGNTVTIPLNSITHRYVSFDSTNGFSLVSTTGTGSQAYGNFRAQLQVILNNTISSLYNIGLGITYYNNALLDYIKGTGTYTMYSVVDNGEYFTFSSTSTSTDFRNCLINRINCIMNLLKWYCNRYYQWYYPLDSTLPEYWRFYNTDTQAEEDIGLAGLMYNISWYLGQLYALQVESGPLTQLSEDVDAAAESMASMESQEESVISSISSGIDSFVPDLSELGAFTALAWCSNYLQQCWVSLGMYGTVIMIGLLLAVCMQFIGYFRYK